MSTKVRATIEDLYDVPENGKAELIDGELVRSMPTGMKPSRASLKIASSLMQHEQTHGGGVAIGDNAGFLVDLPNRESFSPDAAWYTGPETGMRFLDGAPVFAAEVRSENDYSEVAEREMTAKRRDYFDAGALVVWDVDLLSDDVIRAFHSTDPRHPTIFHRGEIADAEPAVPGWRMPVDDLFR